MIERDLVVQVAALSRALRQRGVAVVLSDAIDGAAALTHLDLLERDEVRWGLRTALKVRRRDWAVFDELFAQFWSVTPRRGAPGVERVANPPEADKRRSAPGRGIDSVQGAPGADGNDVGGTMPGYSPDALLRRKAFDECTDQDLAAMERLLRRRPPVQVASRRSRRLVPTPGRGRVDLRRSFRRAVGTEGDLLWLARRARALEEPRLVLLCDTSGSMDPHARFLLAFILSLRRVVKHIEVFAFNTSLTRVTRWLTTGRFRSTLDRLAANVPDWSGGTRIGECLADFAANHLEAVVDARTDVVILSDGLDCGDPEVLASAMRAVRRRARAVVWLNPLLGDARYRPEARGMAAALPFVDRFAPAHNLESLEAAFTRVAS